MTENAETRESQSEEFQKPEPEPTKKDQLRNTIQKGNVFIKKNFNLRHCKTEVTKSCKF